MLYFKDFQDVFYNFGNEATPTLIQDISRYVDVVDQIKDDISFLTFYTIIEGMRPDQVFMTHLYITGRSIFLMMIYVNKAGLLQILNFKLT